MLWFWRICTQDYYYYQSNKSNLNSLPLSPPPPVQISLTIDNKEVLFSLDPTDPTAPEKSARSFCMQRGHEFGVTPETLPDCSNKVAKTLLMQLQQKLHEEEVSVVAE